MNTTESTAEAFMATVLQEQDISTLINCEKHLEPGSSSHEAVYEQVSRFKDAIKAAEKNNQMTEKQALMFTCRFIKSMRELARIQHDMEAQGLDAHVRAGTGTILFIKEDGKWFTKMNRSNDIMCVGAYLAACCKKANAWTFLLFAEEGDVHSD